MFITFYKFSVTVTKDGYDNPTKKVKRKRYTQKNGERDENG